MTKQKEIVTKFNEKIREIGVTQIFISRKTGITPDRVSRILNDDTVRMTAEEFFKLSGVLEVDPNTFMPSA